MVAPRPFDPALNAPAEPPPVSGAMALAHRRYWRFNVILICVLMVIGFSVSFVVPIFARTLSAVRIAGFRLPFYIGAQGAVLIYITLIVVYIVLMGRADRALGRAAAGDVRRESEQEGMR
jgi:putative solute:sodium symporter small subunit